MSNTYIRFPHTVELHTKSVTTNEAGQRKGSWTLDREIPCFFIPISARNRQSPTFEDKDRDQFFVPARDKNGDPIRIIYGIRFKDCKDQFGNILRGNVDDEEETDDEYFEILDIKKRTGYNGALRFYHIITNTVVEND